jgi:hypothetical protein
MHRLLRQIFGSIALVGLGALPATAQGPAPAPWTIPQPSVLESMGARVGGWVDQGITFNSHSPSNGFNGPVGLNDLDREWQMNQLWLYIDRPLQNNGQGWGLGARIDLVYGTDWRFGINNGLEDRINAFDGQTYGMVIPQAYATVGYNDLKVNIGHFGSPLLVYETVPAVANPFYSHSYAIAFSQPLLVTGVVAEYQLNERLTPFFGFHRGWMQWEDNNGAVDWTGGFRWVSDSKRTTLSYAASCGPQDVEGRQQRFSHVMLMRQKIGCRWEYIFQHDFGSELYAAPGGETAEWYGITQYMHYTINSKWKASGRFEWFRDDDGARVAGPPPAAGIRAWPGAPGFAGDFYELTLGLNWRPHPNVLVRPECRWDWYEGTRNVASQLPFNDGNSDSQLLVATDVIFTF